MPTCPSLTPSADLRSTLDSRSHARAWCAFGFAWHLHLLSIPLSTEMPMFTPSVLAAQTLVSFPVPRPSMWGFDDMEWTSAATVIRKRPAAAGPLAPANRRSPLPQQVGQKHRTSSSGHVTGGIRVGTDCSGWESILLAMNGMGVKYDHVFSSETSAVAKKVLLANHTPRVMYSDIRTRAVENSPAVDVYHSGFPCQPFSLAGKKKGVTDSCRGLIYKHCLKYIEHKKPKVVILENVKGLTTMHRHVLDEIVSKLQRNKYVVKHRVLNACKHGVPQNRQRLFVIGIRNPVRPWAWPKPLSKPPLKRFLDPKTKTENAQDLTKQFPPRTQRHARRQVKKFYDICADNSIDLRVSNLVVDIDSKKLGMMSGRCPCLTSTRAACGGHWVACRGRRTSIAEMERLMGIGVAPPKGGEAAIVHHPPSITDRQWGSMLGNAIPVPLLQRLLCRILPAAGLSGPLSDLWG